MTSIKDESLIENRENHLSFDNRENFLNSQSLETLQTWTLSSKFTKPIYIPKTLFKITFIMETANGNYEARGKFEEYKGRKMIPLPIWNITNHHLWDKEKKEMIRTLVFLNNTIFRKNTIPNELLFNIFKFI